MIGVASSALNALARAINFRRIRNVGRGDFVHHFGGRVAEHSLRADIEYLDDALGVRGDAREVGAIKYSALQRPGLDFGANQQIADDDVLRIPQRRDGNHRRKPASVLADVCQFVDVLDSARRFEHESLEARRDRSCEFDAQRFGARDQLPRIGNVGWGDFVHHFGRCVTEHSFRADVEYLNDALRVSGDAREIRAVENSLLQRPRLKQRLVSLLDRGAASDVRGADPRPRLVVSISHGSPRPLVFVPHGSNCATLKSRREQLSNRVLKLPQSIGLTEVARVFNKERFQFVGDGVSCRVEHGQFRSKS